MKLSRRQRRVWLSIGATLAGCAVLTGAGLWIEAGRNTDLTDPNAAVTAAFRTSLSASECPVRFRDVAAELGIEMRHGPGARSRSLVEDTGSGAAWGDVDGDGDWDLYLVNIPGPRRAPLPTDGTGSNRLYRNDGSRFTDITAEAGVGDVEGFGMGATFADYDGDGDQDLYVTNFGRNRLYRNRGDATFEDVADSAGVADSLWSVGAAWGDFDQDGHLDLYVCNYVDYDETGLEADLTPPGGDAYDVPFTLNPNSFDAEPNRLYHNRGDGTFEDVAVHSNVENRDGRSLAATFCDLDGDGWLDLYVNNDVSTNKLYRNLGMSLGDSGPVEFIDISSMTGTADPRGSMGLSVGEIGAMTGQLDGLPDLFITHWVAQENAIYQSVGGGADQLEYRDKTRQFRLGEISIDTVGWGSALIDVDLDGWIDICVANGSTLERGGSPHDLMGERSFVFLNDGQGFHEVAAATGADLGAEHVARGLAAADFDGDGDVDLVVTVNRGRPLLLRNETETDQRSLTVRLDGPDTLRFGARVELKTATTVQYRWWGADVTFAGMHAPDLLFGLGTADVAETLTVRWSDGRETDLSGTPAGKVTVSPPAR